MYKSKLFKLLKTLEKKELNTFARYVRYKDERAVSYQAKMIEYILQYVPNWNSPHFDKEVSFKAIYNTSTFNETKYKHIINKLVYLFYDFITQEDLMHNETSSHKHLLIALNKRGLNQEFEQVAKKGDNSLKSKPIRDIQFYRDQISIVMEKDLQFHLKNIHDENEIIREKHFLLDTIFIAQKLKDYAKSLNWSNAIKIEYKVELIDVIIDFIEQNGNQYFNIPTIGLYYEVVQMLSSPNGERHLEKLKTLLIQHQSKFGERELKEIYTLASNFCIKNINSGNQSYLNELFTIYQQMLENKLFYDDQFLSQWKFMNMVTLGIRTKNLEWTKSFIEEHHQGIKHEFKQNAYNYNLANYHYAIQNYDLAHELLNEVEFNEAAYQPVAKALLLKIYFETKETQAFPYHVEAFKKFVQRNKLMSEYNKEAYLSFLKYSDKLFSLIHFTFPSIRKEEQKLRLQKLQIEINQVRGMQNISWLNEQAEKVLKKI